jgi:hypothetical protein
MFRNCETRYTNGIEPIKHKMINLSFLPRNTLLTSSPAKGLEMMPLAMAVPEINVASKILTSIALTRYVGNHVAIPQYEKRKNE